MSEVSTGLRRLFYEIEDQNGENLIHTVYPSNDSTTKFFILCSEQNEEETLHKLRYIKEIVGQFFEPGAVSIYFTECHSPSIAQHYPKLTENQATFVDSFIDLVSAVSAPNLQEEVDPARR